MPTVEKLYPSGALRIESMAGDYLFSRVYYGFNKREALAEYRHDKAEFMKQFHPLPDYRLRKKES